MRDDEKRFYNILKELIGQIKDKAGDAARQTEFEFPEELSWMNAEDKRGVIDAVVLYGYEAPDMLWLVTDMKEKMEQRGAE